MERAVKADHPTVSAGLPVDSTQAGEESQVPAGCRRSLIIVQNLPVPFDRRVWLEATTLAAAGYQVNVICPKGHGFSSSFEELENVRIHRYALPFDARRPAGFIAEFVWCFLQTLVHSLRIAVFGQGFDILHVCNPPDIYWPLGLLYRVFGKRFLFDHHDLSPEMYAAKFNRVDGALYRGLLFLERMTFRTVDVVIATNESHKRIAIERGRMTPEKVHIVRSGPALARFLRYPPDPSWRCGKRFLLVYLGEICQQDGVDHLVRALKILRDDLGRGDIHCVFVGGGSHQPAIVALAETLGVADIATFTGRVSDDGLCRILSSADLAVDPDPKTPWSDKSTMNKVMEYMYFGLPIVAYDLHESRVSAQQAALYAAPNDMAALARGISGLLDDEARRRRMSAYGARRVRTELAWEHSAPHLLAAYRATFAAGNRRRARPVARWADACRRQY
jgi:glycosyltransferase involved in cell wall biosynthesis